MSFGNTVKDGTGTAYWLLVDSDGRLQLAGAVAHDAVAAGNPVRIGGVYRSTPAAVVDGDIADMAVDPAGRQVVREMWQPSLQSDVSADDSDKTFTVPASTLWEIQSIAVNLVTTVVAGARQMTIEVQDGSANVLLTVKAGATQIASLTYDYSFASGLNDLTAVRDTSFLHTPFAQGLILLPSYVVRVYDSAAIDAAADDMEVFMMVKERVQ